MDLLSKQKRFTVLLATFLPRLFEKGYEVTLGECWRPPEMAQIYRAQGRGITNSLHWNRLAIDLCLFKDGKYLRFTEEYREAGEIWESLSTKDCQCTWGGHFDDGNHFSITHGGVK